MTYAPIDQLPAPPQEWLLDIVEVERVPKPCCGAKPWEGDICICKPLEKQTKCKHCGDRGHTKKTCPQLITGNIACVDYSAGKIGPSPLVSYRWEGEQILTNAGFRWAL